MRDNYSSKISKSLIPYTLPSNWTWFFWSDIMKSYQQGMIRSNRELGKGNVYYLKMGNLNDKGNVDLTDLSLTYATEKEITEFQLKEGDFLINVRNSRELVGKTCVIREINKTILYNHMLVRINNGSPEMNYFINAFLNIPSSKKLLDRVKQGTTTVIALYQRELSKLPIPLPDTLTFNTIIKLYKCIDTKIELNNRINRELEAMAKTLYDYWFVQFDFPNEQGKPYKSSGGKMVYNAELKREIPEGWENGTLGDIAELIRGVAYDSTNIKNEIDNDVIPILRATNISGNVIDLNNMVFVPKQIVSHNQILKKFDILMTMSSGSKDHIGKNGFFYYDKVVAFGAFCAKILAKNNYRFFVYLYAQSDFMFSTIKNKCLGTNINNLNSSLVKGFKLVIPPNDVVKKLNEKVTSIYEMVSSNHKQNQQLSSLRDWLLPMLMNGQVTVKEAEEKLSMAAEPNVEYKKRVKHAI
jgi:type I restriction enzyme S subunit